MDYSLILELRIVTIRPAIHSAVEMGIWLPLLEQGKKWRRSRVQTGEGNYGDYH